MTMPSPEMREKFEKFVQDNFNKHVPQFSFEMYNGDYKYSDTRDLREAWQAAFREAVSECAKFIETAWELPESITLPEDCETLAAAIREKWRVGDV